MASRAGAIVATLVWLTGCTLPPDMSQSAATRSNQKAALPPPGALAVGAPPILDRNIAWTTLTNPRPRTLSVLGEGATLYGIYCAICHGADGAGQGPVAEYFRRMPDLRAPYVRRYPDGRLYHIIREGGFDMPSYASSLDVEERWAVVHHLRTLGDRR